MKEKSQARTREESAGHLAPAARVSKVSFTTRVDAADLARLDAIIEHGDARNRSEALRFALALTEHHYRERDLVDQFAKASREWRDSGDGEAWRAAESDAL